MSTDWEVNYKDGRGWQPIDEEAARLELIDASELRFGYFDDGEVANVDTGHAKYRRTNLNSLLIDTRTKVQTEPNGDAFYAL